MASLQTANWRRGSALTWSLQTFMPSGPFDSVVLLFLYLLTLLLLSQWLSNTVLLVDVTLAFKNWTWALKRSSTWTRPRSSCGWRLWRRASTKKPNTRGWVCRENLFTESKWLQTLILYFSFFCIFTARASQTAWMLICSYFGAYLFFSFSLLSGSHHSARWHDAGGLCQKVSEEFHQRSGCRTCGNWHHGKNGLYQLTSTPSKHTVFFPFSQNTPHPVLFMALCCILTSSIMGKGKRKPQRWQIESCSWVTWEGGCLESTC